MLKRKITKAEFDALHEALKLAYKADGDDYILQVSGFDDPAELKRAKDREVEARKAAELKVKELTEENTTLKAASGNGDIATLERSWKAKLAAKDTEHAEKLASKDRVIQALTIDSTAQAMATEIAGDNAHLILPHIKERLVLDSTAEQPLVRVLDKEKKPSATSIDEFKQEVKTDPRFKSVVIVSKASGGGAAGGNGRASSGAGTPTGQKKFKELNDQERKEWFQRDPAGFQKAAAENRRVF